MKVKTMTRTLAEIDLDIARRELDATGETFLMSRKHVKIIARVRDLRWIANAEPCRRCDANGRGLQYGICRECWFGINFPELYRLEKKLKERVL